MCMQFVKEKLLEHAHTLCSSTRTNPGGCPPRWVHSAQRRQVHDPRPGRGGQVQPHHHVPQYSAGADPHQHPGRHAAHPPDTHPRRVHLKIHRGLGEGELRPTISHDRSLQQPALPHGKGGGEEGEEGERGVGGGEREERGWESEYASGSSEVTQSQAALPVAKVHRLAQKTEISKFASRFL